MKRYLSATKVKRVKNDFGFLLNYIRNSYGELDLRLRDGYFNIYYKGNSLAKVIVRSDQFIVQIHQKFVSDIYSKDKRFKDEGIIKGNYIEYRLSSDLVHPFLQKKYLDALGRNIKKVNYSEEITLEQMIITDNLNRDDFLIIDRQITEPAMEGKRMDLLGLRKVKNDKFQFVVVEVKLGNNPELKGDVADQLKEYLDHVRDHFEDWRKSYEKTYDQMKYLGLFKKPEFTQIKIERPVRGLIAVGGYTGVGKESLRELTEKQDDLKIELFRFLL